MDIVTIPILVSATTSETVISYTIFTEINLSQTTPIITAAAVALAVQVVLVVEAKATDNLLRQALLVVVVQVALEVARTLALVAREELAELVVLEVATASLAHQEILAQLETQAATATTLMVLVGLVALAVLLVALLVATS